MLKRLLGLVLVLMACGKEYPEIQYQGRPFSAWYAQLGDHDHATAQEAENAISALLTDTEVRAFLYGKLLSDDVVERTRVEMLLEGNPTTLVEYRVTSVRREWYRDDLENMKAAGARASSSRVANALRKIIAEMEADSVAVDSVAKVLAQRCQEYDAEVARLNNGPQGRRLARDGLSSLFTASGDQWDQYTRQHDWLMERHGSYIRSRKAIDQKFDRRFDSLLITPSLPMPWLSRGYVTADGDTLSLREVTSRDICSDPYVHPA